MDSHFRQPKAVMTATSLPSTCTLTFAGGGWDIPRRGKRGFTTAIIPAKPSLRSMPIGVPPAFHSAVKRKHVFSLACILPSMLIFRWYLSPAPNQQAG